MSQTSSTAAEVSEVKKSQRFVFVDALRGIAALWIVCSHAYIGKHLELLSKVLPEWALAFLYYGRIGVPIFFVISGFVIAHSVSKYRVDLAFIGRFALRRSIRLDPPYWASIIIVVILGAVSKMVMPNKAYESPTAGQLVAHVFYLQDFLLYPEINQAYWTLPFEIQFYLVFCLLMGIVHATRRDSDDQRSLFAVFVPSLLIAALWPLGIIKSEIWPSLFLNLWHGFLLGMLACWAMNKTVKSGWFFGYALLVGAGGIWNGHLFAISSSATALVLWFVAYREALGRWLNWRWLQYLGMISYSLYLMHNPVTGPLYNIGYRLTGRTVLTESFWFFVMLAVNVAVAGVYWWLLERPSLALAHRFRLQPPTTERTCNQPMTPAIPPGTTPIEPVSK